MKVQKSISYTVTLSEHEAARLSEALYAAVSNKNQWDATETDLVLCDRIINAIGKIED